MIFATSEISYHGVIPVGQEARAARKSFAAYYYTREAPAHWSGEEHSTIFVARPQERYKKYLAMPADRIKLKIDQGTDKLKRVVKRMIGRAT